MPNSSLQDKSYKVPDKVFNRINRALNSINIDDEHAKGVKRAKDLVKDRIVSYAQMKRLKNYFDSYQGDGTDDEYKLVGGKITKDWVDKTLKANRDSIHQSKKAMMDAGMENQFIKTHEKDRDNANPTNPHGGFARVDKSGKMRNIMANDTIYQENYNKEIESIKYLIEYMNKN